MLTPVVFLLLIICSTAFLALGKCARFCIVVLSFALQLFTLLFVCLLLQLTPPLTPSSWWSCTGEQQVECRIVIDILLIFLPLQPDLVISSQSLKLPLYWALIAFT